MNKRTTLLAFALAASFLLSTPASAGVLYDNGSPSGNTLPAGAWLISAGEMIADSFTLAETSTLTGVTVALWTPHLTTPGTLQWGISASPDYGSLLGGGTFASLTNSLFCSAGPTCGFGTRDVYSSSFSLPNIVLGPGTYWLTLQDASVLFEQNVVVYWDATNGPSQAWASGFGPLADITIQGTNYPGSNSESFQILGDSSAPEPASTAMFLSGLALVAGIARRKMRA
jgi:hypothetical protein